jgi:hypothetical protein
MTRHSQLLGPLTASGAMGIPVGPSWSKLCGATALHAQIHSLRGQDLLHD